MKSEWSGRGRIKKKINYTGADFSTDFHNNSGHY